MLRCAALLSLAAVLPGQNPPDRIPTFRSEVRVVIAPTTVLDSRGQHVNGLKPHEFRLYDNDKLQEITEDIGFLPISLVVIIQTNADVEVSLPKIKKVGSLLKDLIIGQDGEIAMLSFDHRITPILDWTTDSDKIGESLGKLRMGSSSSRLIDASNTAVRMLRNKKDRRKVILSISQTRDIASEGRMRDVVTDLQLYNIDYYTLNISSLVSKLSTKPAYSRPDHLPPGARPTAGGAPIDPVTTAQNRGAPGYAGDAVPVLEEIYRGLKGILFRNPAEAFTKVTGGREFAFLTQSDLERAISTIGEELHSQYLLSYTPNNMMEGGLHRIKVEVMRPGLKIRTREAYWMAAVPDGK